jgi:hypothetical protein
MKQRLSTFLAVGGLKVFIVVVVVVLNNRLVVVSQDTNIVFARHATRGVKGRSAFYINLRFL